MTREMLRHNNLFVKCTQRNRWVPCPSQSTSSFILAIFPASHHDTVLPPFCEPSVGRTPLEKTSINHWGSFASRRCTIPGCEDSDKNAFRFVGRRKNCPNANVTQNGGMLKKWWKKVGHAKVITGSLTTESTRQDSALCSVPLCFALVQNTTRWQSEHSGKVFIYEPLAHGGACHTLVYVTAVNASASVDVSVCFENTAVKLLQEKM